MLLDRERPAPRMRRAGMALLALAAGATAWSVWAAQPPRTQVLPAAGDFTLQVEYSRDAATPAQSVLTKRFGESFALPAGAAGDDVAITARVQPVRLQDKLAYDIAMRVEQDGKQIASPRMVVRDGQPASLRQGQDVAGRFRGIDLRMQVAARDPQAALKGAPTLPPPSPPAAPPVPPAPQGMDVPPAAPAPPPPPPKPAVAVLQSGEVDQASRALHPPRYPAEALKEGKTGITVLVVDIDARGGVTGTRVERSSGDARLDGAAQEAAAKWRFTPAMKQGRPVASKVRVPVEFAQDEPTQQAG